MEPATPYLCSGDVDLCWLLSVIPGGPFTLLLTTTLFLFHSPLLFLFPSLASAFPSCSPRVRLPPLFIKFALFREALPHVLESPPRFAYLISSSAGDAAMLHHCLLALYHPRNHYILHLDVQVLDFDRKELAAFIAVHLVLATAHNMRVVEKANLVAYWGPTMVTTTLHATAAILWGEGGGRGVEWDWFINLLAFN